MVIISWLETCAGSLTVVKVQNVACDTDKHDAKAMWQLLTVQLNKKIWTLNIKYSIWSRLSFKTCLKSSLDVSVFSGCGTSRNCTLNSGSVRATKTNTWHHSEFCLEVSAVRSALFRRLIIWFCAELVLFSAYAHERVSHAYVDARCFIHYACSIHSMLACNDVPLECGVGSHEEASCQR